MGRTLAILRNTFVETVRQPVYGLVLAVSAVVLVLTPLTAAQVYSFHVVGGHDHAAERMIADLGLATILLAGLVLAVFTSTSAVSREIEDRTAATVLSRSVSRATFVVAKYLGVVGSILAAGLTSAMILLLTIRSGGPETVKALVDLPLVIAVSGSALAAVAFATWRNYHRGRSWVGSYTTAQMTGVVALFIGFSLFDDAGVFLLGSATGVPGPLRDPDVAAAALLTMLALVVVAGIAVASSTRLGTLGNAGVTGTVFLLGLVSEFLHNGLRNLRWGAVVDGFAEALYALLPNLEKFWVSDALTREVPLPGAYVAAAAGYAALYVGATLLIAGILMETRDVA